MLNVLDLPGKCAEIHCSYLADEFKFSIVCICGLSGLHYDAFRDHYRADHVITEAARKEEWSKCELNTNDPLDSADITNLPVEPLVGGKNNCSDDPFLTISTTQSNWLIDEGANDGDGLETQIAGDSTEHDSAINVIWSEPFAPQKINHAERRPYKPRNKPNRCTYCGRTFCRRYLLDTHLNIHTGLKPHQCDMCGKQFRAVSTLKRHLRTHEQRMLLQCQHCEKVFTHRSALLSHEMRHTQQRRWPCNSCDKCFYTLNQLDTHRRKLHAHGTSQEENMIIAGKLPFACELCNNSYRSASMLSTHKLKKHYKMAKHICQQCGQKFVDDERLQQHKIIHIELLTD